MDIQVLRDRHSVRSYQARPVEEAHVNSLRAVVTDINCHHIGMHFQIFFNSPEALANMKKSYGIFRNADNYLAVVADTSFPDWEERAGYAAQQFVLKATSLGIGTCYIGLTYSKKDVNVQLRVDQKLIMIVAFGYPEAAATTFAGRLTKTLAHLGRQKTPKDFYKGKLSYKEAVGKFEKLDLALEAVSLAPSAYNSRPVRIEVGEDDLLRAYVGTTAGYNAIDLGIAKCNVAAVIDGEWDFGNRAPFYPV